MNSKERQDESQEQKNQQRQRRQARRPTCRGSTSRQKRDRPSNSMERVLKTTSKKAARPPLRSVIVGDEWKDPKDMDRPRSAVAEMSEQKDYRGRSRSRKRRARRRGMPSTSSRSSQRGNGTRMFQHTEGWSANQAPVAPSIPVQTRGATEQDPDNNTVSECRGAGSSDSSSNGSRCKGGHGDCSVESRTTSSERERASSADEQPAYHHRRAVHPSVEVHQAYDEGIPLQLPEH